MVKIIGVCVCERGRRVQIFCEDLKMMINHLKIAGFGEVDLGLLKLLALLKAPPPSWGLTITEQCWAWATCGLKRFQSSLLEFWISYLLMNNLHHTPS